MSEKFKLIPSVYAFLVKENKILLLRRFQTGFEDGNYGLVAGHMDGGETMREAMQREAKEESGIDISIDDLKLALVMHRWCGDHERMDLFFEIKKWSGEVKNIEPEKCDDLNWFDIENLPPNTILYIKTAIEYYKRGIAYIEYGWENSSAH